MAVRRAISANIISWDGGGLGTDCECFDFDGNGQVDLADFAEFLLVYTGPS